MTRLGWGILVAILLVAGIFASMTSFGVTDGRRTARAVQRPADGAARATTATTIAADRPIADIGGKLIVPVVGVARSALYDSWGDERAGGQRAHHGTDIPAPVGTPVVAAAPGVVEKLYQSALGGTTIYVRSLDRRWTFYYAHLSGYAADLREGMRVGAGQPIGFVGDTGDAGAGNYHLHFGLARMAAGERWWQGRDVNPFPLLAGSRPTR